MVLSDYRDGKLSTVDTNDILGILAAFIGGAILTGGLPELFGYVFSDYSWTVGGVTFGLGLVLVSLGFAVIIVTNDLKTDELLDVNEFEGAMMAIAIFTLLLMVVEPQFVTDMVINNDLGAMSVTGLLTVTAALLSTE